MGKDLEINNEISNYIHDLSKTLHPVQSEIISYNKNLGNIKRMQIAVSQCHFLQLIIVLFKFLNLIFIYEIFKFFISNFYNF